MDYIGQDGQERFLLFLPFQPFLPD